MPKKKRELKMGTTVYERCHREGRKMEETDAEKLWEDRASWTGFVVR